MPAKLVHRIGQALAALWCAALVIACGGAGELGSGGTGTGSSAALGTVTGLGSVFVDGVRFDDSNAAVQIDNLLGGQDSSEAKLGQRVELAFTVDGVNSVAQTVRIEPEVVGTVSALVPGGFAVLGQAVLINTDAAVAPVTQFDGGYASLADVRANDLVEVHGVARSNAGATVIQATRIEKRAALAYLRVVGVVAGLSGSGAAQQFTLGGLTVETSGAVIIPAARTLAVGQSVVVLARTSDLTSGASPRLAASLVRIRERSNGPVQAYVGGAVLNLGATSFSLGGVTVNFGVATDISGGTLANGAYVQVRGDFAGDGSLSASRIKVRDGLFDAELKGTMTHYDAAAATFMVRDVRVNASAATLDASCSNGLAEGLYVEVKGRLSLQGVVAQTIKCSADPQGAVIERRGVGSNAALDRTFTLTPTAGAPINVRWTVLTFFRDVAPTTLNGAALRVEGVLAGNGTLVATKIRLDN
jgi:hypothetical protein